MLHHTLSPEHRELLGAALLAVTLVVDVVLAVSFSTIMTPEPRSDDDE